MKVNDGYAPADGGGEEKRGWRVDAGKMRTDSKKDDAGARRADAKCGKDDESSGNSARTADT